MKKTILVLANSIKKGGRCVVGIEIKEWLSGRPILGDFIRPIDRTAPEGSLRISTTTIDKRIVQPLDVIEVTLSGYANDPNHPEDWIVVNQAFQWRHIMELPVEALQLVPHSSEDIWGQDHAIEPGKFSSSVQIIEITAPISIRAFWDNSQWGTRLARKLYLNNRAISITDPIFTQKHELNTIEAPDRKELQIPAGSFIVLSLTPPFTPMNSTIEKQYRVVATIIENDA